MENGKQKLLLGYLLADKNLFSRCASIVKPDYFDADLIPTVQFMIDYVEKYRDAPTTEQIKVETGIDLVKQEINKAQQNYAAEEIATYCRERAVEQAILASVNLLGKSDFGSIIKNMQDAISVGLQKDLGLDYFENPEARIRDQLNSTAIIPTGWIELDDQLNGGISRQELTMFMAGCVVGSTKVKIIRKKKKNDKTNNIE